MSFNGHSIFEIRQQLGVQGQPLPFSHLAKELDCSERSVRNWEQKGIEPRFGMLQKLDGFCKQHGLEPQFFNQDGLNQGGLS